MKYIQQMTECGAYLDLIIKNLYSFSELTPPLIEEELL